MIIFIVIAHRSGLVIGKTNNCHGPKKFLKFGCNRIKNVEVVKEIILRANDFQGDLCKYATQNNNIVICLLNTAKNR